MENRMNTLLASHTLPVVGLYQASYQLVWYRTRLHIGTAQVALQSLDLPLRDRLWQLRLPTRRVSLFQCIVRAKELFSLWLVASCREGTLKVDTYYVLQVSWNKVKRMPSGYLSSTRLHSREDRQLRRLCMTYLISSEPLRALEEPRSSANHILMDIVRVRSTGDGKVRVVARFKQAAMVLVFWKSARLTYMIDSPLECAHELLARLFRHIVVEQN